MRRITLRVETPEEARKLYLALGLPVPAKPTVFVEWDAEYPDEEDKEGGRGVEGLGHPGKGDPGH